MGDTETHGGYILRCHGSLQNQLLDLFEARNAYGFEPSIIDPRSEYREDLIEGDTLKALTFAQARAGRVLGAKHPFLDVFKIRSVRMSLVIIGREPIPANDFGDFLYPVPKKCDLVQAAEWHRTDAGVEIRMSYPEWISLGIQDKMALVLHELLHDAFPGNQTTVATRQAVIYLTAPRQFREKNAEAFARLVQTRQPISGYVRAD